MTEHHESPRKPGRQERRLAERETGKGADVARAGAYAIEAGQRLQSLEERMPRFAALPRTDRRGRLAELAAWRELAAAVQDVASASEITRPLHAKLQRYCGVVAMAANELEQGFHSGEGRHADAAVARLEEAASLMADITRITAGLARRYRTPLDGASA